MAQSFYTLGKGLIRGQGIPDRRNCIRAGRERRLWFGEITRL